MDNENFTIIGVYVDKQCDEKIRKVLEPEYYSLNSKYKYNKETKTIEIDEKFNNLAECFFGENISISAIVGKNGSGKTTLLDIIYRIINNFSHKYKNIFGHDIIPVPGVVAKLFFIANNKICCIECDNYNGDDNNNLFFYLGKNKKEEINKEELEHIFYNIVLNYSFSAFISQDYIGETQKKRDEGFPEDAWIDKIFHKNDGYQTPIVINPYREKGVINITSENNLTRSRLSALLIEASKSKKQIIEGYLLDYINYKIDDAKIISCLHSFYNKITDKEEKADKKNSYIMPHDQLDQIKRNDFAERVLGAFFENNPLPNTHIGSLFLPNYKSGTDDLLCFSYIYIVYKVSKIIEIYPFYKKRYEGLIVNPDKEKIKELVKEIIKDDTHITLKIKQTLNFIKRVVLCRNKDFTDFNIPGSDFETETKSLYEIMKQLPPPFYEFEIYLKREGNMGVTTASLGEAKVPFSRLSSGEKQFIYNITTVIYHIKNIRSIKTDDKSRIAYRNINIIMDEIELCFHPEYQRTFINNLIKTLVRLRLNKQRSLNIIFATHSPFILSDIPKQNILFLKNGKYDKNIDYETFGANISDLLRNSFFLEEGFLGVFAAGKIEEIIREIEEIKNKKEDLKEYDRLCKIISIIGEPLLKEKLLTMLDENFFKNDDQQILRKKKERLIEKLESVKKKLGEK